MTDVRVVGVFVLVRGIGILLASVASVVRVIIVPRSTSRTASLSMGPVRAGFRRLALLAPT
ncbi:MAG: hypothetical protein ACYCV7_08595 [Acidimicrobiales bacterium]